MLKDHVAAISCGIFDGQPVIDLDYLEDSSAGTDANFVMTGKGGIVEMQGTAEGEPFSEEQFAALMALAKKGIARLVDLQKMAVALRGWPAVTPSAILESALYVDDLDAAEAFYATCLGLSLITARRGPARLLPLRRGRAAAVQRRGDRSAAGARCRLPVPPHGARGPGHLCFAASAEEIDALEGAARSDRASPSKPISNGRMAAARSISATRPAIRSNSPSRASGDFDARCSMARRSSSPATMTASCARSPT